MRCSHRLIWEEERKRGVRLLRERERARERREADFVLGKEIRRELIVVIRGCGGQGAAF